MIFQWSKYQRFDTDCPKSMARAVIVFFFAELPHPLRIFDSSIPLPHDHWRDTVRDWMMQATRGDMSVEELKGAILDLLFADVLPADRHATRQLFDLADWQLVIGHMTGRLSLGIPIMNDIPCLTISRARLELERGQDAA